MKNEHFTIEAKHKDKENAYVLLQNKKQTFRKKSRTFYLKTLKWCLFVAYDCLDNRPYLLLFLACVTISNCFVLNWYYIKK